MDYENEPANYDDDRAYRERSRSPRGDGHDDRARSRSPLGDDRGHRSEQIQPPVEDEEEARNTGTNLFVTGIHPRLLEDDITALFSKYGNVEKCNIMRDPHTKDSRGFGFVNMTTDAEADAAKEGLQGEVIEGRTLSIEKARRSKPRTPTPGKYFGPPKNDNRAPRGGRFGGDRYGSRRGGDDGYGSRGPRYGGGGRDRYDDRYDDRGYYGGGGGGGGGRRDRYDDRGYRDDRGYGGSSGGGGRRGGGGPPPSSDFYYERDYRRGPSNYGDAPPPRRGGGGYDRAPPPPPSAPVDDGYGR